MFEAWLARYAPTRGTVEVTLPGGETARFRVLASAVEVLEIAERGDALVDAVRMGGGPLALYRDWPESVIRAAAGLAALAVEPALSELQALRLAERAGALFQFLVEEVNQASETWRETRVTEGVATAKKG